MVPEPYFFIDRIATGGSKSLIMAKLTILTFPDTLLLKKASPIERVDKSLFTIADDMLETMYDAPGVGLAANQVGLLKRLLVIDVDYDLEEGDFDLDVPEKKIVHKNPQILINPQITYREGTCLFKEGCLSVPEFTAEVKRSEVIKVQFQTIDGLMKEFQAEGLLSIAIQHEMDHLEGKLFIDRLSPLKKEVIKKQLKQERKVRERFRKTS